MLTHIHPKLPMRDKAVTQDFYSQKLGFKVYGRADFEGYLMMQKDHVQIHFFQHSMLDPKTNDGMVYIRTDDISGYYRSLQNRGVPIHPQGKLEVKPWGQKEFSLLDPDNNLITFGQGI